LVLNQETLSFYNGMKNNLNYSELIRIYVFFHICRKKMNEHEGDLGNVDIYYEKGLILTSSIDGNVKIWN
jgi:hypothetical protein